MKIQQVALDDVAHVFRVHPRTILRAITEDRNIYWYDDHNPMIDLDELAEAYDTTAKILRRVFEGRDELLTPDEAATITGVKPRAFRYRGYTAIRNGGIVRYLHSKMAEAYLEHME